MKPLVCGRGCRFSLAPKTKCEAAEWQRRFIEDPRVVPLRRRLISGDSGARRSRDKSVVHFAAFGEAREMLARLVQKQRRDEIGGSA